MATAKYPDEIPTTISTADNLPGFTTNESFPGAGDGTLFKAEYWNQAVAELVAVMNTLGTNPEGNAVDVATRIATIETNAGVETVALLEVTALDLDAAGRAVIENNSAAVGLDVSTAARVGLWPDTSLAGADRALQYLVIKPNGNAVTLDERAHFNPHGFSVPAGDSDNYYIFTIQGNFTSGTAPASARSVVSKLVLPIPGNDQIGVESGGNYYYLWEESGGETPAAYGSNVFVLSGTSILADPPYGVSIGAGKYAYKSGVSSGFLEFGPLTLEVDVGDGLIIEESNSGSSAKHRVSKSGTDLVWDVTTADGNTASLSVPYAENAAGRCRFTVQNVSGTLTLTCEGVSDSVATPVGALTFDRAALGAYYSAGYQTDLTATGVVYALGYADTSFGSNTERWFNVNRRLSDIAQSTDFATRAYVDSKAAAGGVGDIVADYTASTDAVAGVLTIDLAQSKNVVTILMNADVTLALANTTNTNQQLVLLLIGNDTPHNLGLSRIRYDLQPVSVASGVRMITLDLNQSIPVPLVRIESEVEYDIPAPTITLTEGDGSLSVAWGTPQGLRFFIRLGAGSYTETTENPKVYAGLTNGTQYTIEAYAQDYWGNTSGVASATGTPQAATSNPSAKLVVADPAALHQSESELKAWLESLGYAVTLVDDGDTPNTIPDLTVYGPIADNGATAMNRYRAYPGPLIMMANIRAFASGLSVDYGANQTTAGTAWSIIDTSHPITQGLSTTQTVWSTAKKTYGLRQAYDLSGAVPLVDMGNEAGLRAVEAFPIGISLNGGYTSTHRAVAFCANNNSTGSDRGTLYWTADYKTLLERSIQWVRGLI